MTWLSVVCVGAFLLLPVGNLAADLPRLVVAPDGRSFLRDNEPFFWLGDDAWGLFNLLSLDLAVPGSFATNEVEHYLQARLDQGFTVIHTWLGAGWMKTNRAGHGPFEFAMNIPGPVLLNEKYFDHVAEIINLADQNDFYIMMEVGIIFRSDVPEWWLGGFDADGDGRGDGTADHEAHVKKSYEYGWRIANALKKNGQPLKNLIWGLGQDIHPQRGPRVGEHNANNNGAWLVDLVRALAEGIADGTNDVPLNRPDGKADYSTTLMSFHPGATRESAFSAGHPSSSSTWFHSDTWLDFNTRQSGRRFLFNDAYFHGLVHDYGLIPTKPTFDIEGGYESASAEGQPGRVFRDYHVRLQAYWTMLSGGFGFGYGHGSVYPFSDGAISRGSDEPIHWVEALSASGATQLRHLRHLLEARHFTELLPDHAARKKLLITEPGANFNRIVAARSRSGSFGIVYTTNGRPFEVDLSRLSGQTINAWWFNPRTGETTTIGFYPASRVTHFDPPGHITFGSSPHGNDWVLVLDDVAKVNPFVVSGSPRIDVFASDVVYIPEAQSKVIEVALGARPTDSIDVTIDKQDGDSNVLLLGPVVLTFDPDNWDTVQVVLLQADNDADSVNGHVTLSVTAPGYRKVEISVTEVDDDRLSNQALLPTNIPPIAKADRMKVFEGSVGNELTVLRDNGAGADKDRDDDELKISAVIGDGAASGQIFINSRADGLLYTPNADFAGTDRYKYTITDDRGGFSTATVTIEVLNVDNDPPRLDPICDHVAVELGELSLFITAPDPDGGEGIVSVDLSSFPPAAHFDIEAAEFSWTPSRGDALGSPYSMTVTATDRLDATLSSNQTVRVLVNSQSEGMATPQQGCLVVIEAEDYDSNDERSGHRWVRDVALPNAPTGYSGTAALRVLPKDYTSWHDGFTRRAPEVGYNVEFASSGTFVIWVRAYSYGGSSNSFHAGLDGAENVSTTNVRISPNLSWVWVEAGRIVVPTAGRHTLNLWARESGAVIDKIVLSRDPDFTPEGQGPMSGRTAN